MTATELAELLDKAWTAARGTEPARGQVTPKYLDELRVALEAADAAAQDAEVPDDEVGELEAVMSALFARASVVAIAAGNEVIAARWIGEAKDWTNDEDVLDTLGAAGHAHERYRALVHGRYLMAHQRDSAARKCWQEVAKIDDVLGKAATAELAAPRPIRDRDSMPTLRRVNGIGAAFYGRRDHWPDGSYATTHCISVLWVPLFAMSAWRVRDADGGYTVMAREQLSAFARLSRWVVLGGIVVAIGGYAVHSHYTDPGRVARVQFDDAVEAAASAEPEAALRQLDGALSDLSRIDRSRAEHAGAEVVRLTAGFAPKPFTAKNLDQGTRLINRYRALPDTARGGAAYDALDVAVTGWLHDLGDGDITADARLTLLRLENEVADAHNKPELEHKIADARRAVATAKVADAPVDALAILLDGPSDAAVIEQADKIVARLVESPSVLVDAAGDLDAWAARTKDAALAAKVSEQRGLATTARDEAMAEGVTPKQLADMHAKRPWDQFATLMIARDEAAAGKLDAAAARIAKLGPTGLVIRDARFLLGQLVAAQGKLDEADAIMTGVIGPRLAPYAAASAKFHEAFTAVETRLKAQLDAGNLPPETIRRFEAAPESDKSKILRDWFDTEVKADPKISAARDALYRLGDVVPVSLAAGSIKLRRAQTLSGSARNAMLEDAERMFLAIRAEAEGQPEFRLGLGEIYARLGKTKESEAEFAAVLAEKDPKLEIAVAQVYRNIGSMERAKQVATGVYDHAPKEIKERAATLLGVLTEGQDEDVSESWFRKANQSDNFVQTSLLEIEGQRLSRQGKSAECAAKFAAAAKNHLAGAGADNRIGYNNAAVADQRRFECNGDLGALKDAAAALDQAYRARPDEPLVVGNYAQLLEHDGRLRVLGKRIDVKALRLTLADATSILTKLVDSPERDAVLAELGADASLRKAADLSSQFSVLAPNNPVAYELPSGIMSLRRDEAGLTAILDSARHAKAIDTSEGAADHQRWLSGANDDKRFERLATEVTKLDQAAAIAKDPKTRAAALFMASRSMLWLGLYKNDPATLVRARDGMLTVAKLWPALDMNGGIAAELIDEAGLAVDAKAWIAMRRERTPAAAVMKAIADHAPIGEAIRGSKQWAEVVRYTKADTSRPGVDDLRLARLIGDAALETRAMAVFDDKVLRTELELARVLTPTDAATAEDLAYLDKR